MKRKMEILLSANRRLKALTAPTLLAMSLSMSAYAVDLPTGEDITHGDADIFRDTDSLTVDQHTSNLVINWDDFSIASGNTVNFLQNRSDMVLNRVVGDNPSNIFGSINAGGQVFLINQSGILFAPGARVDAAGLVASTLDMADADFLSGNYVFEGAGGDVINQGELVAAEGGYVALLGRQAINEGIISARLGSVALASGDRIAMDFTGDGLIRLEVDSAVVDGLVSNHNLIYAEGGRVYMTASAAGDLAATVVNNEGIIEANGVEERDGQVFLTATGGSASHSGAIDVSGAGEGSGGDVLIDSDATTLVSGSINATSGAQAGQGGNVRVLGDLVGIENGAAIDASGVDGGGEILVGGDYQGGNSDVRNASRTFVGDVTLTADAIENGDGGRIIVWADEVTRFYGGLSATGGANGGDGGFAEVSGKQNLGFYGSVDLTSAYGSIGTLLLDPEVLQIVNTGGSLDGNLPTISFLDGGVTETVGVDLINAAGASIVLEAGQIEFLNSDNITLAAGNSISFTADSTAIPGGNGTITNPGLFSFSINTTGGGTISFDADGLINLAGVSLNSPDAVSLTSGSSVALGNVNAGSLNVTAAGNIVHSSGLNSVVVSGQTTLTADSNPINVTLDSSSNDFNNVVLATVAGGSIATASVRDSTALVVGGNAGTLLANAGGALEFSGGSYTTLNGNAGGNITQSGALTVTGTTTLTSSVAAITAALNAANDFGTVSLVSTGGSFTSASITDTNALNVGGNAVTLTANAAGALGFTGGSYTTLNGTAGDNISQSGALTVSGASTLTSDAAPITVDLSTGTNDFNTVTLATSGAGSFTGVSISDDNALSVGDVVVAGAGDISLLADDNLTITGTVSTATGDISLNADDDTVGTGLLTLAAGSSVDSANDLTLTAADFEFDVTSSLAVGNLLDIVFTQAGDLCLGAASGGAGCQINLSNTDIGVLTAAVADLELDNSGSAIRTEAADFGGIDLALLGFTINDENAGTGLGNIGALTLTTTNAIGNLNGGLNIDATSVDVASSNSSIVNLVGDSAGNTTYTIASAGSVSNLSITETTGDLIIASSDTTGTTTLVASAGKVDIDGAVNSGGAVAMTGSAGIDLGANVTTTADDVTFNDAVTLTADALVDAGTTGGATIAFNSTVDGPFFLDVRTINTSGDVNFNADVGASTALDQLQVLTHTASFSGNVTTTGSQNVNADNTATTNGTHTSDGATIQFLAGGLTLGSDTVLDTGAAGGNIRVSGGLNGANALTLSAGTGDVIISTAVGDVTPLASLTVTSATTASFGGDVTTVGAQSVTATTINTNGTHTTTASDISLLGNVILEAATTLTTGVSPALGNITVSGTIDSDAGNTWALDLTAGDGNIDLQSAVGATDALASLTVNSATAATFGGDVTTTGAQDVTATTINTNGTHTTTDSAISLRWLRYWQSR